MSQDQAVEGTDCESILMLLMTLNLLRPRSM